MNTPPYSRLPGRSGLIVRNALWIGPDHLLSVRRNPFFENYRRYYFGDIQSIILTELPNPVAAYSYTAAALIAVTAGVLFYTQHPLWAGLCVLFGLIAFILGWQSADCSCFLTTSISKEALSSLRHLGDAQKTVAIVKAAIEKVQGSIGGEVLQSHAAAIPATTAAKPQLRHCDPKIHWLAFALLTLRSPLGFLSWKGLVTSVFLGIAAGAVGTAVLILLIFAAVRQYRSDLAVGIRRLVYVSLAWYVAGGMVSFAVSIYVAFQITSKSQSPMTILTSPVLRGITLADLVSFFILGCIGLIFLWRYQRTIHASPPPLALGHSE